MTYLFGLFFVCAIGASIYVSLCPKLSNMNEGMWKITTDTKMPGEEINPQRIISQCLTKENYVPQISIPGYECRIQRRKHMSHAVGNHVFWSVHCEGPGVIQGTGHIKYSGDTVKGKIQLRTVGDKQGADRFNCYISGYRTGTCSKKEAVAN